MKNDTIQQTTDKSPSALDLKIFDSLRAEVADVSRVLADRGATLSRDVLVEASSRILEVARFAEAFHAHGVSTQPATGGVVKTNGDVQPVAGEPARKPHARLTPEDERAIVAARKSGETWDSIAKRVGVSLGAARAAYTRGHGSKGRRS